MSLWVVVPAAGTGTRFGGEQAKQYSPLAGRRVIEHTLERLLSLDCEALVVTVQPTDRDWPRLEISRHPKVLTAAGGSARAKSVLKALEFLGDKADEQDWVLVHDVVRPCIMPTDLRMLCQALAGDSVGGLLATPVVATLKRVAEVDGVDAVVGRVVESPSRDGLWQAATPQMFRYGLLRSALAKGIAAGGVITDEASALEQLGYQPLLVRGRPDNIKITFPEDLPLAAAILEAQVSAGLERAG